MFVASCQGNKPDDMVLIPASKFQFGIDPVRTKEFFNLPQSSGANAQPARVIHLDSFYIDRYEVSYQDFIKFKPKAKYETISVLEPVRGVSWFEADAYCMWRGKRLPSEREWEKAARGSDGFLFTWGNAYQDEYANFSQTVRPVGQTPHDISPYKIHDLNGNVAEWTDDWYQAYPDSDHKDPNFGKTFKVTRGGAIRKNDHGFMKEFSMVSFRNFAPPHLRFWDTGFRCAQSL